MSVLLKRKKHSLPPCQCDICSSSPPVEDHQSDGYASTNEKGSESPQELPRRPTCCGCCCRCRKASESEDTESSSPSDTVSSQSGSEEEEDSEEERDKETRERMEELRAILHRLYNSDENGSSSEEE